jgi:hypothetical protein
MKSIERWTLVSRALPLLTLMLGSTARAEYRNCSEDQINTLAMTDVYAGLALIGAGQDLASVRRGEDASRFETWFGTASDDSLDAVESVLSAAYNGGLSNANYICGLSSGCGEPGALMWTEHGSALGRDPSWGVYVCDLFFERRDRQVGSLVHELTHLYGTSDTSTSEDQLASSYPEIAQRIAASDPGRAIKLAINYEYYVLGGQ